ncbi:hypothetical protein AB6A40_006646 [Gnathostoma spinigerum]|uniref:Guanosine-3',5'-bis(diphosphate) 3'-pyrophosphohydrolase MESH1 n=1 Tax=Gnathostoma spinigerum TaxID=75299 RepID=A0ABD6ETD3_9BILA
MMAEGGAPMNGPPPSYEESLYPSLFNQQTAHSRREENINGTPVSSSDQLAVVIKACDFAARRHRTQRRKDLLQTPYINHPIGVAHILTSEANITDLATITAAILHDTVEDTNTSFEEIEEMFGKEVHDIVKECSDDKSLPREVRKKLQVENAPRRSLKARLVIMADKLYNCRDAERSTPVGWDRSRKLEYMRWAKRVVERFEPTNKALESALNEVFSRNLER